MRPPPEDLIRALAPELFAERRTLLTIENIERTLTAHSFLWTNEDELQNGIGIALHNEGIPFEREVRLNARDRIDFMTEDGVGIEVKINGTLPALTRQTFRYLGLDALSGLVVAVTQSRLTRFPPMMCGKPLRVVRIRGSLS
jgi:hypothetical protein